jgi:PAS domain S-box-containing protein
MVGWASRHYALTQLFTERSAMQPWTALSAILTGAGVIVANRPTPARTGIAFLASVIVLIAVQALAQHVSGVAFGSDRLLFPHAVDSQPIPYTDPGRMAAPTATAFLLLGISLLILQSGSRAAGRLVSAGATAVLLLAAIAFLGHLYAVAPFTGPFSFTQVALPTALALAGLSIGVLTLRPERGWVALLVGKSVGATAARLLLPLMIAIPIIVASLALKGSDVGFYPPDFRLALTTAVTVVLLGALALWGSWQLDSLVAVRRTAEISQENEATLRAFFETEGLFASIVERRGNEIRYLAANRALSGLFGKPDVTGLRQRDLVGDAEAAKMVDRLRKIEAAGRPSSLEMQHGNDESMRWFIVTISPIMNSPADAPRFATASFEITERKRAEALQRVLLEELNHRVKNTLAVVQSLAVQTFRGDQATPQARQTFDARLAAVASANTLLLRQEWETVSLHVLVADTVGPGCGADSARIDIEGPDLALPARMAVSLTLALHELCTNAVKYGALSNENGRIGIRWAVESGEPSRLHMDWTETGGPPVVAPSSRGFGSRLIERALSAELRGPVKIDFHPEGIRCSIDAPLPRERA